MESLNNEKMGIKMETLTEKMKQSSDEGTNKLKKHTKP
jgi:hypothetical protein